jgi:hypothetical protein
LDVKRDPRDETVDGGPKGENGLTSFGECQRRSDLDQMD